MKVTKLISGLALIIGMTTQQGCSEQEQTPHYGKLGNISPDQPLTLLGKTIDNRRATLYYDMDGDPQTTEVVCRANAAWMDVSAKAFDSKVGDTKPLKVWHQELSHKDYEAFWVYVRQ